MVFMILMHLVDETVGKKYAALLIQHIWRSRAARTRKVMEMFQGSQGTIRLRVRVKCYKSASDFYCS